jgi:hypothetical protein
MFKFLRQWLQKPQTPPPHVEFCSSCWRGLEDSKPWIETWKNIKLCRDCLLALNNQLHIPVAEVRDPTRLVILPYSENPYQPLQVNDSADPCQLCGMIPKVNTAVLYNKLRVCERCIRVSLQLLEESDNAERVRL